MPTYFEVMNRIYMPHIMRRIKEREEVMADKKVRTKHVGYAAQREFCRNNKHTYIEKFSGDPVLMCNYPFPDPYHKKGVCRANTCTDMREIPDVDPVAHKGESGDDLTDKVLDDVAAIDADNAETAGEELQPEESKIETIMPCASND